MGQCPPFQDKEVTPSPSLHKSARPFCLFTPQSAEMFWENVCQGHKKKKKTVNTIKFLGRRKLFRHEIWSLFRRQVPEGGKKWVLVGPPPDPPWEGGVVQEEGRDPDPLSLDSTVGGGIVKPKNKKKMVRGKRLERNMYHLC